MSAKACGTREGRQVGGQYLAHSNVCLTREHLQPAHELREQKTEKKAN